MEAKVPEARGGGEPVSEAERVPLCPGCALGKMHNASFPPSKNRTKERLICIHSDIKSFPIESYHRHKYFISFVDDYTSFAWISLLCAKSSTINVLQEFLAIGGFKVEKFWPIIHPY